MPGRTTTEVWAKKKRELSWEMISCEMVNIERQKQARSEPQKWKNPAGGCRVTSARTCQVTQQQSEGGGGGGVLGGPRFCGGLTVFHGCDAPHLQGG